MTIVKAAVAVVAGSVFLALFAKNFVTVAVAYCTVQSSLAPWYGGAFAMLMLACFLFPAAMVLTGLSPLIEAIYWNAKSGLIRELPEAWRIEMRMGPVFLLPVASLMAAPAGAIAMLTCWLTHQAEWRIAAVIVLPPLLGAAGMWMARRTGMVWVEIDKASNNVRAIHAVTKDVHDMGTAKTCAVMETSEEIAGRGGAGQHAMWLVFNTADGPMPVASALTKWPSLTPGQVQRLAGKVKSVMGISERGESNSAKRRRGR